MKPKTLLPLIAVFAVALPLAGCGGDNSSGDSTTNSAGQAPAVTGKAGEKPAIAKPDGDPPTELIVKDLKVGKGKKARKGDNVSVQYVGVSWSTGEQFDASWDRGAAFDFPLGGGQVIQGWDQGVEGMRVGGRRELVIPPGLAYGAQGQPPTIAPNETLVFVVDLEKVSR
jgi:peptidylprolyl isomerase